MEEIKYKFTAIGRNATKEVFPQNGNTLAVSWEKEKENAFFRKKLKGKMMFTSADFHWLYVFETSQYRCDPVQLIIEKQCSGAYSDFFVARLILNQGDWDLDQCTVSIEAEVEDRYTCYTDNKDKEYNLFGVTYARKNVQLVQGTLEYQNCSGDIGGVSPSPQWCGTGSVDDGWTILSFYQTLPGQPDPERFDITWVREVITATGLGSPWIDIGGGQFARTPALYGYRSYGGQFDYGYDWQVGGVIDNGIPLQEAINGILGQFCYPMKVKSYFFNWDQPYSANNYVTGLPSKVDNLILFQKSDVKRPNGTGNATIANISIEKLIKDICNIFQLKWDIDEDGNFIIEHVSFFQKGVGLNLIDRSDSRFRAGMRKYFYDIDNMPRREIFQMADDKAQFGDFKGLPIIYSNSCVGKGEKEDKDWIVENIMTNIGLALTNPNPDSQVVSDDGFILVACDSENHILSEGTILGGNSLNNTLSWARLHIDYWRFDRVFNRFSMNGVQTDALSVMPTKKGQKLEVILCCGEDFDPENKVLSLLGEGIVQEATYDIYKELLSLTLLYPADDALVVNNPPVAVNDNAITWVGLAIDIDVLANDTDSDGTINPGTLTIVYEGSNGTASVVDAKIRYIPNPGYTGTDIITYNVKDNWEEKSNDGTVSITIKPGSPLPIANDDLFVTAKNAVLTIGTVLSNDTGDGDLSCIPETKATEQGGSIQIYANGSAVYTPPSGYVGSDGFNYTMKDGNNNTDVAHVEITVFEKQQVYARYSENNTVIQNIVKQCQLEPGNFTQQIVGTKTLFDLHVKFYSDVSGTIPMNVNGYGLLVKLRQVRSGDGAFDNTYTVPASGFEFISAGSIKIWDQGLCDPGTGEPIYYYEDTYSLETSPDYIIL